MSVSKFNLDPRVDELIGRPEHAEDYPWLSERRYAYRKSRETTFCEGVAADQGDPFKSIELRYDLDLIYDRANLTLEERTCFQRSQEQDVLEIAAATGLGAKTVRRRIASAVKKMFEVIDR
jgi:hypothetical protein